MDALRRAVVAGALLLSPFAASAKDDDEYERLRAENAKHYTDPKTHIALAKYLHEHGDSLMAYFICQDERRASGDEKYAVAYDRAWRGEGPESWTSEAEAAALAEFEKDPSSRPALAELERICAHSKEWAKREECVRKAVAARPDDYDCVMRLAFVLAQLGKVDEAKALGWEFAQKHADTAGAFKARVVLLFTLRDTTKKRAAPTPAPTSEPDPAARAEKTVAGDALADLIPLLREATTKFPDDGTLAWYLGWELWHAHDFEGAAPFIERGAAAERVDGNVPAAAGKFFREDRKDTARALAFYLQAYFIDRYSTDSCDPVETRIQPLAGVEGTKQWFAHLKRKDAVEEVLKDENLVVAFNAVLAMEKKWDAKYVEPLLDASSREESEFRMTIAKVLVRHLDASHEERIHALMKDADPRRRALAGALTVWQKSDGGAALAAPLLADETELVRIRIVKELATKGTDEAKAALRARRDKEPSTEIKEMIAKAVGSD